MKATHNPPTAAPVTTADLLRMAALYLRRHGWHQGSYYATTDTPTPPACAVGAIGIACTGHRIEQFAQLDTDALVDYLFAVRVFTDYLDTDTPAYWTDELGFVLDDDSGCLPYSWNDIPGRTAEQVITALEAAADEWDRLHTDGGED
ncbi:hypothetical protein FHU28_000657 [Micromonospora echinospora]|uniref:SUKH-3 immunity protein n=1 Tax=Micromonospora echinospora TaxID=1877 RepID=A0ABR6M609_MICEC|nr:hypothetical protein [Micromonospora echinospora]MBB5110818.1 hypothetical protein [Micromonospora echinospora]